MEKKSTGKKKRRIKMEVEVVCVVVAIPLLIFFFFWGLESNYDNAMTLSEFESDLEERYGCEIILVKNEKFGAYTISPDYAMGIGYYTTDDGVDRIADNHARYVLIDGFSNGIAPTAPEEVRAIMALEGEKLHGDEVRKAAFDNPYNTVVNNKINHCAEVKSGSRTLIFPYDEDGLFSKEQIVTELYEKVYFPRMEEQRIHNIGG